MKNQINQYGTSLLIFLLIPILTGWDSLVGCLVFSVGLVWLVSARNQGISIIIFGLYLGGWLSWWLALPWWQTTGLILLLIFGQRLIQTGSRHYQILSLSYLLGSIVVVNIVLNTWSQLMGIWTMLACLSIVLVMLAGWWWVRRGMTSKSGTSWYVQ